MSLLSRLLRRPTPDAPLIAPMRLDDLAALIREAQEQAALRGAALAENLREPDAPILPQVTGPTPQPCCPPQWLNCGGWTHGHTCPLRSADERYPVAGPPGPRYTDPGWTHLNGGAS
jgi:hypothetical protein